MIQPYILLAIFLLLSSLAIMIWACDVAINNAVILGKRFGISDLFMGIFIIAIGTSLPEFAATVQAMHIEAPGIVAGNLVGSNIANILLVGGVMLLPLNSYKIEDKNKVSLHFFLLISFIFSLALFININLSYFTIPIIIILLGIFLYLELRKKSEKKEEYKEESEKYKNNLLIIIAIIFSFIILYFSSGYFISYAKAISSHFGISDTIVGVSIVALGTSLPEVITTMIALYKKKSNLALGNIIGSCVANITIITLIAIILGDTINFYELLNNFNKALFILTALIFYGSVIGKFTNRMTGIVYILIYSVYILTQYTI
tara:strand:- start:25 stop:975 length:951 start_codon:yes stop_codon:yes gene_type:complete